MMILSSLLVLCLAGFTISAPATIVSGFGVEGILEEAQKRHDKMVDSSPEKAGAPVVDGSTEDSSSHESNPQKSSFTPPGMIHVGPDTVVSGREHIHDPEHGNDDVIFTETPKSNHKMQKVTTEMFGADDVEVGGNSEDHHHHYHRDNHQNYNPDIGMQEKQQFKKGWAPTEIVWSSGTMSNGYNGGIRRPEYRNLFAQRH
ncbi:Protein CBG22516 [Caenorhabditis briggsae]|uniref:Protein CBG22516 n=1 Tax=Caenorhabditis briggsae TaxID=6238 RepID=A8Y2G2_CAEBR|nr:Protein CBG22516 [Caenorhabditis briggsae]CAP39084.2 Protein CBG22516 [Caenorhabditis briggsae]